MTQTRSFSRTLFVSATFLLSLGVLTSCGKDDGLTDSDGQGCATVGEYSCFDNVVHLCRYLNGEKVWKPTQDCSASETPDCQCIVYQDQLGKCSVGASQNTSNFCQGHNYPLD